MLCVEEHLSSRAVVVVDNCNWRDARRPDAYREGKPEYSRRLRRPGVEHPSVSVWDGCKALPRPRRLYIFTASNRSWCATNKQTLTIIYFYHTFNYYTYIYIAVNKYLSSEWFNFATNIQQFFLLNSKINLSFFYGLKLCQ